MPRFPRPAWALAAATVVVLVSAAAPSAARVEEKPTDPVDHHAPGRILVTFKPGTSAGAVSAAHRESRGRSLRRLAAIRTEVVRVDDVGAALAEYRARGDVEWAGRDGVVRALEVPADNQFVQQWNLKNVAESPGSLNWQPVYRDGLGEGVLVAVIDSGIGTGFIGGPDGFEHEPFRGRDFVSDDFVAQDDYGHGTHVAGTIAQRTGNAVNDLGGTSVAGVAPDARLLAVRVLDDVGEGSVSTTIDGIIYAVDEGAKVINLSLGGDFSKPMCDAVSYAVQRGALVVAASGNESEEGMEPVTFPGACPGALAVGGHKFNAERAKYSNGSCELGVTAPGGDVEEDPNFDKNRPLADARNGILQERTVDSPTLFGFSHDSGTSMAAAHVAGAAAVLMGPPHNRSAVDTMAILRATARDLGAAGPDDEYGAGAVDLAAAVAAAAPGAPRPTPSTSDVGYWMVASDGGIFSFGKAPFHGSTGNLTLASPIVAMARTVTGRGYWLAAADGGVFAFGDARFYGSMGGVALNSPIVGMAPFANGRGYWLVARDGGIFAFGEKSSDRFYGSTGNLVLNQPIVGMAPTRTGKGYWLVARDGGIFSFGDAVFHGSTGNLRLNAPIVAIARTPTGGGYWMVATDGGIFSFGDARFHGSTGNIRLNKPIVSMAPTCFGFGYWLFASDGGVFAFGEAPFLGSTGNIALNRPMVGALLATDHRSTQR